MNDFFKGRNIIATILFSFSGLLTVLVYLSTIYEYQGKGYLLERIISDDAVLVIIFFTVLSMIVDCIAIIIKKNRTTMYVFIILIFANICKILQLIYISNWNL